MELADRYLTHSLNNSLTKAAYSFSRSSRKGKDEKKFLLGYAAITDSTICHR
jgi:hypothetical protein